LKKLSPVVSTKQILTAQKAVRERFIWTKKLKNIYLDIVFATRYPERYNLAFHKAADFIWSLA